jgi:glutamine synthetase
LSRISEKFGIIVSYNPKIIKEINGSRCYINFSTIETRVKLNNINFQSNCIENIYNYIEKLSKVHKEHTDDTLIDVYDNDFNNIFSFGIGTTNTSIRIPNKVITDECGYFEDRRLSANIDPYLETSKIFKTCCL